MNKALQKEINYNYKEAISLYETHLDSGRYVTESAYANLAFLYWQCASDYGFVTHHKLSDDLQAVGGERYPVIVEAGLNAHPRSMELHFWRKYFPHRHYFDDFSQLECEALVRQSDLEPNLIPYFFLYLFDPDKYKLQRDKLLDKAKQIPSAKFNYIRSLID